MNLHKYPGFNYEFPRFLFICKISHILRECSIKYIKYIYFTKYPNILCSMKAYRDMESI